MYNLYKKKSTAKSFALHNDGFRKYIHALGMLLEELFSWIFQLLYFSATGSSQEGFLRALSVAAGTHMPRIMRASSKTDSVIQR